MTKSDFSQAGSAYSFLHCQKFLWPLLTAQRFSDYRTRTDQTNWIKPTAYARQASYWSNFYGALAETVFFSISPARFSCSNVLSFLLLFVTHALFVSVNILVE